MVGDREAREVRAGWQQLTSPRALTVQNRERAVHAVLAMRDMRQYYEKITSAGVKDVESLMICNAG